MSSNSDGEKLTIILPGTDFRNVIWCSLNVSLSDILFTLCFLHCLSNVRALACFCFCCCRYTMYMLVRMSEHVINNQHMGSFLGKTFGNCLIKVKRGFDKCVVSSGSPVLFIAYTNLRGCDPSVSFQNCFEAHLSSIFCCFCCC